MAAEGKAFYTERKRDPGPISSREKNAVHHSELIFASVEPGNSMYWFAK